MNPMFEKKPTYVYSYLSKDSKAKRTGGYYQLPDKAVLDTEWADTGPIPTALCTNCSWASQGYKQNVGGDVNVHQFDVSRDGHWIYFMQAKTNVSISSSYNRWKRIYLPVGFDISSWNGTIDATGDVTSQLGIHSGQGTGFTRWRGGTFSHDGSKFFYYRYKFNDFCYFETADCGTPFDLSSAVRDAAKRWTLPEHAEDTTASWPMNIRWAGEGTHLYLLWPHDFELNYEVAKIGYYTCATPYDVTTRTFQSFIFALDIDPNWGSNDRDSLSMLDITEDGKLAITMFGTTTYRVFQLATPFDLTSGTQICSFSHDSRRQYPRFNANGSKIIDRYYSSSTTRCYELLNGGCEIPEGQ